MERRNLIIDLETHDPDDVWQLFLVAGHPRVNLKAITVVPGSPAQILLVHHILNGLAGEFPSHLGYLQEISIGYTEVDKKESWGDAFAACPNKLYKDSYPAWVREVQRAFNASSKSSKACDEPMRDNHDRFKKHVFRSVPREIDEGWRLILKYCDRNTTLLSGGPISNLGKAIHESRAAISKDPSSKPLEIGRWVAQGGFVGTNITNTLVLPKGCAEPLRRFCFDEHNPAWNFDQDHLACIAALDYDGIRERWFTGKNVCHLALYNCGFHAQLGQVASTLSIMSGGRSSIDAASSSVIAQPESVAANRPATIGEEGKMPKKSRWGKKKHNDESNEAVVSGKSDQKAATINSCSPKANPANSEGATTAAYASHSKPTTFKTGESFLTPSLGVPAWYRMMSKYPRADGKKLHDLVSSLAAIDPALSGCVWKKVNFRWVKTEGNAGVESMRHKNGGEWACLYAMDQNSKGELTIDENTLVRSHRKDALASIKRGKPLWNVNMAVGINLEQFEKGLLAVG